MEEESKSIKKRSILERLAIWFETNAKFVIKLFIFFIVFISGFFLFSELNKKTLDKLSTELYLAKSNLDSVVSLSDKNNSKDKNSSLNPLLQKLLSDKKGKTYKKEFDHYAKRYEEIIRKYSDKDISIFSALDLSYFYYEYGKKKEAISLLESFEQKSYKSSFAYQWLFFKLASYYMDENRCKDAIVLLEKIIQSKKSSYFHDEVFLQMGICYENLGDLEKAKFYSKKAKELTNSSNALAVDEYIRFLELTQRVKKINDSI